MEHEINANWVPMSSTRPKDNARRTVANCRFRIGLAIKIFLVGVATGYILSLCQQAVQKSTREKTVEVHREY